jgi:hypothetical protein
MSVAYSAEVAAAQVVEWLRDPPQLAAQRPDAIAPGSADVRATPSMSFGGTYP